MDAPLRLQDLGGKNIVILGSGREGAAALRVLTTLDEKATVRVVDEYAKAGQTLEGTPVEAWSTAALDDADVIIRSPGVSIYRPDLQGRTNITTPTSLWFAEPHSPVIAFTGTKGKSTSSSLTAHLLNALGLEARLAGNIGQSPLDLLGIPEPKWWVLELSSFQVSDLIGTPEIAAMTSFSPEHLDWHGNAENYLNDKTRLLELTHKRVVNPIDIETRNLLKRFPDATTPNQERNLPTSNLRGKHNEQLIRLVFAVLEVAGIDLDANADAIAHGLSTFEPLPHRLEPAGTVNDVEYFNDSLSTTPIATRAAIEAFDDRPTTVLVGGYDRGVSYDELGAFIRLQSQLKVITLPDCGDRIAAAIDRPELITHAEGLEEAVAIAAKTTPRGGAVLLSPGAASFGHFIDYADRGRQFVALVQALSEEAAQ